MSNQNIFPLNLICEEKATTTTICSVCVTQSLWDSSRWQCACQIVSPSVYDIAERYVSDWTSQYVRHSFRQQGVCVSEYSDWIIQSVYDIAPGSQVLSQSNISWLSVLIQLRLERNIYFRRDLCVTFLDCKPRENVWLCERDWCILWNMMCVVFICVWIVLTESWCNFLCEMF